MTHMTKHTKVGATLGVTKLGNLYDPYVLWVLGNHLEPTDNRRQFKVVQPLPDKIQYEAMKTALFTYSVTDLINDGFGELQSIGEELRDWFDNLGNLQATSKGEALEDSASTLENLDEPDLPDLLAEIKTVCLPHLNVTSRARRASEAADKLRTAASAIIQWIAQYRSRKGRKQTSDPTTVTIGDKEYEVEWDELQEIADTCLNAADEADGVEFPGMY